MCPLLLRKAISVTHFECLSTALVIQHKKFVCHVILSSVASPAPHYFYSLSHKHHELGGEKLKFIEHKMCVLISSKNFVWNFSYSKNSAKYYHKYTLVFMYSAHYYLNFNRTWIILTEFPQILKKQILWKFIQWEPSCSIQTDRHDKVNNCFLQLSNTHNYKNSD
jgi:hypothetical protein